LAIFDIVNLIPDTTGQLKGMGGAMTNRPSRYCFLAVLVAIGIVGPSMGQTTSTEIVGLVTDRTGAVIPGATVTVKRVATGDVRQTRTNQTGNYTFPFLDIGEYEVTCSVPGFKTEVRRGIILELQQKARIDFQPQVGDQVETVEVVGATPLLRTEDAALGSVIESKRVVDLPLNGRNFAQLATLMPGVVFGAARMGLDGQSGFPIPGQGVAISANGQRDINQHATLDGVIATQAWTNTMQFVPSIEAIEEFRVQSAVYSAEYGTKSGAQINVAIKSGANALHGTLFEFLRNDKMDARGFFLAPQQPKNKLRRNQYGAVLSGPVVRDKTFWMFNWEARRERRATPSVTSVPTLAMRAGDFSEIIQPQNRWYPSDPNPAVSRAIRHPGSPTPFANNIIPPSLISPVSTNLLTWNQQSPFPEGGFLLFPNIEGQARAANSPINVSGTNNQNVDSDQLLGRFDHRFGDSDRIFARYIIVDASLLDVPLAQVTRRTAESRTQNLAVGYSKIITPTLLNDFRFGFNPSHVRYTGIFTGTDFTHRSLGLDFRVAGDNNRQLRPDEEGLPNINITGFSGIASARESGQYFRFYIPEFSNSTTLQRGRHNFKFGGLHRYNFNDLAGGNIQRGVLNFTRDIIGVPDGFAAFLLGIPESAQTAEGIPAIFGRQHQLGFYWLDDFKATSKLTVNFGVRWDIIGSIQDAQGRFRALSFVDGEAQTNNGMFVPLVTPNPGVRKKLYDINLKQIMPRLGIAYRLTPKVVLRMGAGQFYNAQQMANLTILQVMPPFSGSNLFQNNRQTPQATIDNPFAGSAVQSPAALIMLGNIQASRGNRPLYLNNDIWQWTVEIEQSLAQDLVTGIAYVGSKASNIDMSISNFNNPDPGAGNIQLRRPLQFYVDSREPDKLLPLGTVRRIDTSQNAFYHALQLRAEKRYSQGLTFVASYNFQKAIATGYGVNENAGFNANSPQNPRNIRMDRGRSAIDQRHRFVVSHIWELPWFRDGRGLKRAVLGGWAVNGIIQLTSGLPVTVNQTGDSHNTGAASQPRPHILAGKKIDRVMAGRSIDRWFDTGAFVRSKCDGCPGEGVYLFETLGYGNAGVTLFDAPAQKTWDFALFKDFSVKESHRMQFRWEVFNFLNTPQFGAPDRSLGSATFGRVTSTVINNREMQLGLKYIF
jgi:hypothetical protein